MRELPDAVENITAKRPDLVSRSLKPRLYHNKPEPATGCRAISLENQINGQV
jgi:hypothetical protein